MHTSLEAQASAAPCMLHAQSPAGSSRCRCWCRECTLGCSGTPCKPFSIQRAKRYASGAVKEHKDAPLTQEALLEWLKDTSPQAGFFENVTGWDMPEEKGSDVTPLGRQVLLQSDVSRHGIVT